jgi:putative hydrolase
MACTLRRYGVTDSGQGYTTNHPRGLLYMKLYCDTHSHTVASNHAYSTINDYLHQAETVALQLISMTDHGPMMPDSPHPWHFGNMKVIPRMVNNIGILRGIEANILPTVFQGTARYVDLPDRMLPFLDFAIASFHEPVFTPASKRENTQAMIRAIESGVIQIIGHPGNPSYPIDQDEVIRAAKDNNVLLEINNSSFLYSRQGSRPFCESIVDTLIKHDWKISVGSDAHISFDLGNFAEAIELLTGKNFPQEKIVTQHPLRFLEFLAEHNKPVANEMMAWAQAL